MNADGKARGKVFVFSGILPICDTEDGLAAVLGHEIAHNVAHHTQETTSQLALMEPLALIASMFFDISAQVAQYALEFAYARPGSRKQEVCCLEASV